MRIGITEILVILVIVLVVKVLLDLFMNTKAGFLLRAEGDNPTLGLILCSERNEAVAKYSLLAGSQQLFASRYRPFLPSEAELQAELQRDRALLENQREAQA